MAKSKIARSAANMAAKKAAGKTVAKAVAKKAFPAYVAYEAVKGVIAAKTATGKVRAAADITLPTMALGAVYAGTTKQAQKEYQTNRTVNGDRGVNPTTNPNKYNKAKAKGRNPSAIQGKL